MEQRPQEDRQPLRRTAGGVFRMAWQAGPLALVFLVTLSVVARS